VCDLEISRMKQTSSDLGSSATEKKKKRKFKCCGRGVDVSNDTTVEIKDCITEFLATRNIFQNKYESFKNRRSNSDLSSHNAGLLNFRTYASISES
jgi:hypothetical protein